MGNSKLSKNNSKIMMNRKDRCNLSKSNSPNHNSPNKSNITKNLSNINKSQLMNNTFN